MELRPLVAALPLYARPRVPQVKGVARHALGHSNVDGAPEEGVRWFMGMS